MAVPSRTGPLPVPAPGSHLSVPFSPCPLLSLCQFQALIYLSPSLRLPTLTSSRLLAGGTDGFYLAQPKGSQSSLRDAVPSPTLEAGTVLCTRQKRDRVPLGTKPATCFDSFYPIIFGIHAILPSLLSQHTRCGSYTSPL